MDSFLGIGIVNNQPLFLFLEYINNTLVKAAIAAPHTILPGIE